MSWQLLMSLIEGGEIFRLSLYLPFEPSECLPPARVRVSLPPPRPRQRKTPPQGGCDGVFEREWSRWESRWDQSGLPLGARSSPAIFAIGPARAHVAARDWFLMDNAIAAASRSEIAVGDRTASRAQISGTGKAGAARYASDFRGAGDAESRNGGAHSHKRGGNCQGCGERGKMFGHWICPPFRWVEYDGSPHVALWRET